MSAAPNLHSRSSPPRPTPGSYTRALRPKSAPGATTTPSRPAPPRPGVAKSPSPAALRPPPLPNIEEPDAEALDFEEEMDDTEWHDVSAIVSTSTLAPRAPSAAPVPSLPADTEVTAFRVGAGAHLVAIGRGATTFGKTAFFFAGFLVRDALGAIRNVAPAARALLARLGVQWMRASERARS